MDRSNSHSDREEEPAAMAYRFVDRKEEYLEDEDSLVSTRSFRCPERSRFFAMTSAMTTHIQGAAPSFYLAATSGGDTSSSALDMTSLDSSGLASERRDGLALASSDQHDSEAESGLESVGDGSLVVGPRRLDSAEEELEVKYSCSPEAAAGTSPDDVLDGSDEEDEVSDEGEMSDDRQSSEDEEISDEDEVTFHDEDADVDLLAAASDATETKEDVAADDDDSLAGLQCPATESTASTSVTGDDSTLQQVSDVEAESDSYLNVSVDREEEFLGLDDVPKHSSIVYHRVTSPSDFHLEGGSGKIPATGGAFSLEAGVKCIQIVSPTSDYSEYSYSTSAATSLAPDGNESDAEDTVGDDDDGDDGLSLSVGDEGQVTASDTRLPVSTEYADYPKTIDVDVYGTCVDVASSSVDVPGSSVDATHTKFTVVSDTVAETQVSESKGGLVFSISSKRCDPEEEAGESDGALSDNEESDNEGDTTESQGGFRETYITSVGTRRMVDPSQLPLTRYHVAPRTAVADQKRTQVVRRDSPAMQRDSEDAVYVSTLFIPQHAALRNAESKSTSDGETHGTDEDSGADDLSGGGRGRESSHYSVLASVHRNYDATFDVGRPRRSSAAATPLTLSAYHWAQVTQVSASYIKGPDPASGSQSDSRVGVQVGADEEQEAVVVEEGSDLFAEGGTSKGETSVCLQQEDAEKLVTQTAEAPSDTNIAVVSWGGEQTTTADSETGPQHTADDSEVKSCVSVWGSAAGAKRPSLRGVTFERRILEAFLDETESPDKLCYFSHISDDSEASDEEDESKKVTYLDLFLKDYGEKDAERRSGSKRVQISESTHKAWTERKVLSQRVDGDEQDTAASYKITTEQEDLGDQKHYTQHTLHIDDTDSTQRTGYVKRTEEPKHREYLELNFEYSGGDEIPESIEEETDKIDEQSEHKDSEQYMHTFEQDKEDSELSPMATALDAASAEMEQKIETFVDRGEEFVNVQVPHRVSHFRPSHETTETASTSGTVLVQGMDVSIGDVHTIRSPSEVSSDVVESDNRVTDITDSALASVEIEDTTSEAVEQGEIVTEVGGEDETAHLTSTEDRLLLSGDVHARITRAGFDSQSSAVSDVGATMRETVNVVAADKTDDKSKGDDTQVLSERLVTDDKQDEDDSSKERSNEDEYTDDFEDEDNDTEEEIEEQIEGGDEEEERGKQEEQKELESTEVTRTEEEEERGKQKELESTEVTRTEEEEERGKQKELESTEVTRTEEEEERGKQKELESTEVTRTEEEEERGKQKELESTEVTRTEEEEERGKQEEQEELESTEVTRTEEEEEERGKQEEQEELESTEVTRTEEERGKQEEQEELESTEVTRTEEEEERGKQEEQKELESTEVTRTEEEEEERGKQEELESTEVTRTEEERGKQEEQEELESTEVTRTEEEEERGKQEEQEELESTEVTRTEESENRVSSAASEEGGAGIDVSDVDAGKSSELSVFLTDRDSSSSVVTETLQTLDMTSGATTVSGTTLTLEQSAKEDDAATREERDDTSFITGETEGSEKEEDEVRDSDDDDDERDDVIEGEEGQSDEDDSGEENADDEFEVTYTPDDPDRDKGGTSFGFTELEGASTDLNVTDEKVRAPHGVTETEQGEKLPQEITEVRTKDVALRETEETRTIEKRDVVSEVSDVKAEESSTTEVSGEEVGVDFGDRQQLVEASRELEDKEEKVVEVEEKSDEKEEEKDEDVETEEEGVDKEGDKDAAQVQESEDRSDEVVLEETKETRSVEKRDVVSEVSEVKAEESSTEEVSEEDDVVDFGDGQQDVETTRESEEKEEEKLVTGEKAKDDEEEEESEEEEEEKEEDVETEEEEVDEETDEEAAEVQESEDRSDEVVLGETKETTTSAEKHVVSEVSEVTTEESSTGEVSEEDDVVDFGDGQQDVETTRISEGKEEEKLVEEEEKDDGKEEKGEEEEEEEEDIDAEEMVEEKLVEEEEKDDKKEEEDDKKEEEVEEEEEDVETEEEEVDKETDEDAAQVMESEDRSDEVVLEETKETTTSVEKHVVSEVSEVKTEESSTGEVSEEVDVEAAGESEEEEKPTTEEDDVEAEDERQEEKGEKEEGFETEEEEDEKKDEILVQDIEDRSDEIVSDAMKESKTVEKHEVVSEFLEQGEDIEKAETEKEQESEDVDEEEEDEGQRVEKEDSTEKVAHEAEYREDETSPEETKETPSAVTQELAISSIHDSEIKIKKRAESTDTAMDGKQTITDENTQLLVSAGTGAGGDDGGGDDSGSGDNDDDDNNNNVDDDVGKTREAEPKIGDRDAHPTPEEDTGLSSEFKTTDILARETVATVHAEGVSDSGYLVTTEETWSPGAAADRFVDREEEFADIYVRPTFRRERVMGSVPSSSDHDQQQRLLEDIKSNKARTEVVLEEHDTLRDRSGETTPSQGHRLLKEIEQLEETAEFQRAELQSAVSEQEQYETEIRHLNAAISEAQQQLLASPVRASTVEALKQQIAEHNSLASQIKAYQARVSEINEKSRQLSLRVAQSSTIVARKRYLPEMVYRTWVSAARSDEADSSPMSATSHTMDSASFDSGLDTGANVSLSVTLQSQGSSGSRPYVLPSTPRSSTGQAMDSAGIRFKPVSDSSRLESSTSFRSDTSDSFTSQHPGDVSVKFTGSWSPRSPRLQEVTDSYKVKSASDTHLAGSSSFMKKLQGQGQGRSSDDKVTTPRSRLDHPPWSLSDHDRPAHTSTPRGRVGSRPDGVDALLGSGRWAFSLSPDKGRKAQQASPPLPSFLPASHSSSSSLHGRGTPASFPVAGGGGHGHDVPDSRVQEMSAPADEPRARSSSFGQKVEPLGRPLGSGAPVEELNESWTTLQKQVAAKEKELKQALQKQERYQQAVQELTAKMERAQISLTRTPASVAANVDTQMSDYKDTLVELDSIKEDIAVVREHGRQMIEMSDAEGSKAMEATLTMLGDRITSLQSLADQKGKQLQDVVKHKKKHNIALTAYKKRITDLESWLGEMKVRHATMPLPIDDPADIQRQLQENRDLQEELNSRLQLMSDLAVQCDNLCELEPPSEAEKLRNQLSGLHSRLGEFKLLVVEKQTSMRAALKDSEKRHKEMGDYEDRVGKLQKWMTETKQMTVPAESTPSTVKMADHSQLQQDLASDLSKHQQLVRQLAVTQPKGQKVPASSATESRVTTTPSVSEAELHTGWLALQKELEQKTRQLEDILQKRKAGETIKTPSGSVGDTSRQLHDIQSLVAQLSLCWQQLQVQVQDKQLRLETALSFQQQMQSALTAMSAWLDTAEQIVLAPSTGAQSEHDRIRQNEALQRELRGLQSEISTIGTQAQYLLSQSSGQSHGLIQESLTNLNQRVGILEKQAVERSEELRHAQHQWQQYHDDVRSLRTRMQELQTSVVGPPTTSTATLDSLVTNINKLETALKKCETQLDELKGREKELSVKHPRGVMPSELGSLRTSYMDLQRKLVERKAGLMQSVSVQEQYQNMLKDYADFLETAEGKLKTEAISARDLSHLKQQLSAHKEFFSDLEVHKAMLDSLASQCDPATQDTHSMQHTRLRNLTHMLVDQASLHGQRLERLMRQWIHLADKLGHLHQFLAQVEEEIPKPIASGDSLSTIQEKLGKFKRLQGQLADERPTVFQAVDQGKQLLHIVACPALETGVTELADKWVELNTQLVHELKKTETIGEQLQIFEAEAMVLKTWMSTARMKLDDLKHLNEEDMQNIGNIRTKVEHILEFRKEVQNQLPLKSKVMSVGRQLIANRNYDTRGLDARLDAIEVEWTDLEQCINTAEQMLHQAQMELMPSRQALHELQLWMEEMERALAADANSPIKNLADIEVMLKTYKGYKVELASKQLTMDFVNQGVLQPGVHDIGIDTEKLEYAEKLNELNRHWKKVSDDINDRLRSLEQLSGKWAEYEVALAQLQTWFKQQEDKIKRYRLIGHEVGVKQTLKDCKAMQDQLQSRKEDMDSVKLLGQSLIELSRESPGCQHSVRESLSALSQQWEQLQQQMMQLESLLSDMLGQWARYHADLQSLNQVLNQTEYTLNRYSLVGADMQTLLSQVDKLKSLEQDLKQHSSHLDSFSTLATQLCQVCEPPVQAEVQSTVIDMKTKWNKLSADLSTRRAQFERCLGKWREYEEEYKKINEWLTQKEAECSDLVAMRDDVAVRHECLEKSLALQQELDGIQPQLSALYSLSDDLTKNMGTSTIVLLTSRQSAIEQRLLALRQLLSQHIHGLNEDLSQVNRFREAFATVKKFLEHAESVLSIPDPNKTAEQSDLQNRLVELKQLLTEFQANFGKLDEVNDLGYRLALASSDSSQLLDLNHQWHEKRSDCQERSKALQAHLLMQQDFTAKCQTWMAFLANTERDLATKIAGNLTDLLDQQRKCQDFEGEMYSHQQVLHAIISDGQKMMRAGEVEDPKEFEEKLSLLKEQWLSVSRRANQRKTIIDDTIRDWHLFNSLGAQLQTWLAEKRENLKMFDVDKLSLQQIRNLLDKVKTIQSEFRMQEESFRKVHDLGATLLERADPPAAQEIKVVTAQLQNGWLEVYNQLEEHHVKLEALQKEWHECEDEIEEILTWLKSIRQMLNADIPNTYDGLQADLTKCKDISTSFDNSEDKRQALLARERKLGRSIQAEDMNVLHQRIRLLNKQWDELKSQANLRDHRLQESTFRWSSLGEHMRALLDWIQNMEVKIMSSREIHVEDLLHKLQTEYEDAMALKGKEVEEVVAQGEQLMKNSSDVRASDIGQRLKHLKDQWNHLIGVAEFRSRKLQETVLAVKQLDSSMRNLSHWLGNVEQELTSPIVYHDCDMQEIHTKLQHTQDIQRDIEQHSAGVSSVLNLCEVLLHDADACPTETEFEALQHAMKNLDRRWKNICELCPERRTKIKETWELWEAFSADCGRFSEWLGEMEVDVGDSEAVMPASVTKEDIRKYEALQRKVHDHLTDLEAINKQYRRLAKEGRTDTKGVLRSNMQEANDRWDALQQRVTAMMQGLRHSASIREDFLTTHFNLMQWLTEVDMQITNIEHLSQLDTPTKIKELQRIEEEIDDRRHRMDYLNQAAVLLIQQGTEEEAERVQRELDEFKDFSGKVLERVANCRARLSATHERYAQGDQPDRPVSAEWDSRELEEYLKSSPPESPPYKRRAGAGGVIVPRASVSPMRRSVSPPRSPSPSRRSPSPMRRSVSPRRSASPTRRSSSPSRWRRDVTDGAADSESRTRERNTKIDVLLEQLADALDAATAHLDIAERMMEARSSVDGTFTHKELQTMLECETRVDTVLRLDRLLKIEAGTTPMPTVDAQVISVIECWKRLQSRATERDVKITQQQRDLSKFASDVESLLMWLGEAEALQASHDTMPSDIAHLNVIIRQHKDFMVQLESKRAHFLSIQLLSKNYINLQSPEGRQLQSRVRELEQRWESVTTRASETQCRLQGALLHCQEFHHTVQDYLLWLEGVESRVRHYEPVRLSAESSLLWDKYNMLKELRSELEENQPAVMSLRETADQLLASGELPEMAAARDKTHIISNRLRSLIHLTNAYIQSLETKLGVLSSSVDTREGRLPTAVHPTLRTRTRSPFALLRKLLFGEPPISLPADVPDSANLTTDPESLAAASYLQRRRRRAPLLYRVLRTALPLQLLLLLLLGMACLVPFCEDDYSCLLANNLRHSFSPMLRYTDGAPPT